MESGLSKNEIMKIKLPLAMNSFIPYFLDNDYISISDIDTTGLYKLIFKNYLGLVSYTQLSGWLTFPITKTLNPNAWYHLLLIGTVTSLKSSYLENPVELYTYSSTDVNAVLYDSNQVAGFIHATSAPKTLTFTLSLKSDEISLPSASKTSMSE